MKLNICTVIVYPKTVIEMDLASVSITRFYD
jgi:hypothetical protein